MSSRCPRCTPPPHYEPPPPDYAPVDLSSSPSPVRLHLVSPSGLSEAPEQDFDQHPLSFDPYSYSDFSQSPSSHRNTRSAEGDQFPKYLFTDSPHQHPATKNADPVPQSATEGILGVFLSSDDPKPKGVRTKCKILVEVATPEDDSTDDGPKEFEIVVHVVVQDKKTAGKKAKTKVDPVKFGPMTANVDMDYAKLMEVVAEALDTKPVFLAASSFECVKCMQMGASGTFIIIKMDPPAKQPATQRSSWAESSAGPSSAFDMAYQAAFGVDDDNSDDGRPKKKVPFDEGLEEEIEKLTEKYLPGVCSLHPTISCFHNRVNDLHFELDHNKKIVWAASIKKGTASLITAPIGSNLFNAKAAIKKKNSSGLSQDVAQPPVLPSTPAAAPDQFPFWPGGPSPYPFQPPAPGYPSFPPMPYPAFPSYPPSSYGHPPQNPHWDETPRRRRQRSWDGSSPPRPSTSKWRHIDPPSSPAYSGGSIDEFLAENPKFPPGLKPLFDKLGFDLGDEIGDISEAQWASANILQFTAARIVKSYNKYKASLRALICSILSFVIFSVDLCAFTPSYSSLHF
ncbi:hypothetical protein B0H11DRAFT_2354506 [Mycena galericulata]|nr:hypothetical protein B0H11DRAFT_2354506 [Mycena galericulata]